MALTLALGGCVGDVTISDVPACDGQLQSGEDFIDDVFDRDGDGYFDAFNERCAETYTDDRLDCDDANPNANPIAVEVECNDIDDDCDPSTSDLDERGCVDSYSGTWSLDSSVSYSCALGNVNIDFDTVVINHEEPDISVTALGGVQPGSLEGTVTVDGVATATKNIPGACTEDYVMVLDFITPASFEGSMTASYTGGFQCAGCTNQSWSFNGSLD